MLSPIDILIILSSISAVQAGPLRRYANIRYANIRYANTTSQITETSSGVVYNPAARTPALSLAPVAGVTTLPFSLIAAEAETDSSTLASTLHDESSSTFTHFSYQPFESVGSTITTTASPATQISNDAGPPTNFWTFGNEPFSSTVTVTSTSFFYTTAQPGPQASQSTDPHTSRQNARPGPPGNATSPCTKGMSQTSAFTIEPVPTTTSSALTEATTTTTSPNPPTSSTEIPESSASSTADTTTTSTSSTFAYPYPNSSTPPSLTTTASDANDEEAESQPSSLPKFSFNASAGLPEVVTESEQQATATGDAATATTEQVLPGITIVPQNPSVIYITVTEAGVTTTVGS